MCITFLGEQLFSTASSGATEVYPDDVITASTQRSHVVSQGSLAAATASSGSRVCRNANTNLTLSGMYLTYFYPRFINLKHSKLYLGYLSSCWWKINRFIGA